MTIFLIAMNSFLNFLILSLTPLVSSPVDSLKKKRMAF